VNKFFANKKEQTMRNVLNWLEIPAIDFERAVTFYGTLLGSVIRTEEILGIPNGILPYEQPGVGGAIVGDPRHIPSTGGTLIYLNAAGELETMLSRVETAGGQILLPATSIGPMGTIAVILDSEGNRIGLHQEAAE
jgi:predicted enzyme related to lactoylglutathione lyase